MPSLSLVEGWHAPAGRRTWQPRPLAQARQIRPAAPVGARKPGARPTDRLAGQPERRQPNRRSGRDPGPDPTPTPSQNRVSRAGSTIHILPAGSTIHILPADYLFFGGMALRCSDRPILGVLGAARRVLRGACWPWAFFGHEDLYQAHRRRRADKPFGTECKL